MQPSGRGESRLDRIERLLNRHVLENHDAHTEFRAEHRVLLTAQIVLAERMDQFALGMVELTEKLNALIGTVDGIIGSRGAQT